MSSFSNKMYSWNFLINSKVHFLCTYPLLYPAGMCNVMYTEVYNTYLHGKCFLSTLYNNISCLTAPQSMLLFVSSDSGSHAYGTSWSSLLCTDQCHTSFRNTACSVFAFAANTCDTTIVFLRKANTVNALLPVNWTRTQMDLVYPLKCH